MKVYKIIKYFLSISFFLILTLKAYSKECSISSPLKIGLIDNQYIDYKYYLSYFLSNYTLKESIDFELTEIENELQHFDIIFGEYFFG